MKDEETPRVEQVDTVEDEVKEDLKSTAYYGDHTTKAHHISRVERTLVLKARLLIGTLATLVFFVAYLDRNSIGNARLLGLQKDLHLTANQYYNVLTMFFVGYIIFMLPANVLLRKFSPHKLIGGTVVLFGALVCAMGGANNYSTVLALRILTGSAQSFVNGFAVYISVWFKRDEVASITAAYYSAATISGAFSGFIAYGVDKNLTAKSTSHHPWQWLLIIDGALAMGVGVLVILLLPRFPDRLKKGKHWLFTAEEIELACERVASYNTLGAQLAPKQIWVALKDPKSWSFALIQNGIATGIGTVGVFLPSFVKAFGYSAVQTQLFTAIPYACAFVTLIGVGILSDWLNKKGPLLIGCLCVTCIGYIILLTDVGVHAKVVATCLVTSGLYPTVILLTSWVSVNTAGFTKRGTTWAICEVVGQSFSIMGTHVYDHPPRYIKGHSIVLAFNILAILSTVSLMWWMNYANKKKDLVEKEYVERGEEHPHATKSLEEVCDFHVSFRYIL